uniref:DUF4116 domain-containing protein n=1 Tax=viral metagenome TaxID=1070528 RepID=A0A6C0EAE2_9ZZZZ
MDILIETYAANWLTKLFNSIIIVSVVYFLAVLWRNTNNNTVLTKPNTNNDKVLRNNNVYSGKKFNELTKGKKFYKLTNEYDTHFSFKYKNGLNIDTNKFNPANTCSSGGLYFTDSSNVSYWYDRFNYEYKYIREVTVPNDALVYVEDLKYKADKIVVSGKSLIEKSDIWKNNDFINSLTHKMIEEYFPKLKHQNKNLVKKVLHMIPEYIDFVKNRTVEYCRISLEKYGDAIKYIKNPTDDDYIKIIQRDISFLKYIKNPSAKVLEYVVRNYEDALNFIPNPSIDLIKLSLEEFPSAIKFVKQTDEICNIAIKNDPSVIRYIKNKTYDHYKLAIEMCDKYHSILVEEDPCLVEEILEYYPSLLEYVKHQSDEACTIAIKKDPSTIRFVHSQTPELCNLAISLDVNCSKYIKNFALLSDKMFIKVIRANKKIMDMLYVDQLRNQ